MKLKQLFLLPFVVTMLCANAEVENYVIDTDGAHASIEFRAMHLGYSWLTGRFTQFSGSFIFDEDDPKTNSITVDINVDSIDSNHALRDKHLKGPKYLDTEVYSDAKFVSSSITPNTDGTYQVVGDFTLHEQTNEISFTAKQTGTGPDPWGGYRRGFEAETEITFADYGYEFNLGPSTKTAIIRLYLEGIKQPTTASGE